MLKFKQSKYSSKKKVEGHYIWGKQTHSQEDVLPVEGSSVTQVWCIITQWAEIREYEA